MTTYKKLLDVTPGDLVIGVGLVEQVRTDKEITTLVVRDLSVPMPAKETDAALRTYMWKSSQLVDIGEANGSGD